MTKVGSRTRTCSRCLEGVVDKGEVDEREEDTVQLVHSSALPHLMIGGGLGRLTVPSQSRKWFCLQSTLAHQGGLEQVSRAGVAQLFVDPPEHYSVVSKLTAHEGRNLLCRFPAPMSGVGGIPAACGRCITRLQGGGGASLLCRSTLAIRRDPHIKDALTSVGRHSAPAAVFAG